jgi:hypothetical protein
MFDLQIDKKNKKQNDGIKWITVVYKNNCT